jgi:hypothetical protein
MIAGVAIFALFAGVLAILIISYERPTRARRKITGRGGDFAE